MSSFLDCHGLLRQPIEKAATLPAGEAPAGPMLNDDDVACEDALLNAFSPVPNGS